MNKPSKIKSYVTGIGVVSPLGEDIKTYWSNLISGKSGIGQITLCDPSEFPSKIAGEVKTFQPEKGEPAVAERIYKGSIEKFYAPIKDIQSVGRAGKIRKKREFETF